MAGQCFVNYRTGEKSGDCSTVSDYRVSETVANQQYLDKNGQRPATSSDLVEIGRSDVPGLPDAPQPSSGTPAAAPQPQSLISLGNQTKQPLDAIQQSAAPSLRQNIGRRAPSSMSALLAQMARVY